METRRGPATATKSSEEPKSSVEPPRPLLDSTQRKEIRNYIDAYKAEIVDSSSIEIDDGEVERIKQRYQEMMTYKNTMENAGQAYWKDGFRKIETEAEGGKATTQLKSVTEERHRDSPMSSGERVESKRSVGIPRVSPTKSR